MKNVIKGIIIFFLLLLIILIVLYFFILFSANSPSEDNWFNENYRDKFAQNQTIRFLFNLHRLGDAKTDYLLNDKCKKLIIEFDEASYCEISNNLLRNIKNKINTLLVKPEGIDIIKSDILESTNLTFNEEEIKSIIKEYKNYKAQETSAVLYILCLNRYADKPEQLSMAVNEDSIVIFWNAYVDRNLNTEDQDNLMISSILYQFNRQMGLTTINKPDSLMQSAEKLQGNVKITPDDIITELSPEEMSEIENIRDSF